MNFKKILTSNKINFMKNYFLLSFICILTLNSCKQNKISSGVVKGENSINISKSEYESLIADLIKLHGNSTNNLAKYVIDDELAKEFVQEYLTNIFGYVRKNMERSVFFTFDDITSTFHSVSTCSDLKDYGFRVYFAEYTDSAESISYLRAKFGDYYENYFGMKTVIIQIMNKANDKFIRVDGDLLNYNLGELCPPCLSSNNASGLDGDWYIQD